MKLRAVFEVSTIEEVAMVTAFSQSSGLPLSLVPHIERKGQTRLSLGKSQVDVPTTQRRVYLACMRILEKGPVARKVVVGILTKKLKLNPKSLGSTLSALIRLEALEEV
jgi:hypothetical protein